MASPGAAAAAAAVVLLLVTVLAQVAGSDVKPPLVFAAPLLLLLWLRGLRRRDGGSERRVCVLVLGDVGRSPRMQYHSLSLSRHGFSVTLVGFLESKPHQDVLTAGNIRIVPIAQLRGVTGGPRLLTYVTKVMLQCVQLLWVMLTMELQAHVLLQNPPGLPSMAVAWLACAVRGSRLTVDWHNYGYSILALSHGGERHPLVRVSRWYERFFGPLADHHLCVTEAMKTDLGTHWGIRATTLYDRPASIFAETPVKQRHQLFSRLAHAYPEFQHTGCDLEETERTVFSERDLIDDTVTLRTERPALLISSTSWTEDEDFSVLLSALEEYEGFFRGGGGGGGGGVSLPSLVCVITGKGPQKDHYRKLMDSMHLEHVKICTPWLEAEDYPLLLGSADLGVCLHKSSSGLDLPMKVVDMFGCCLPVCAVHFHCLHELMKHEENGLIFRDARELAQQLKSLLSGFPDTDGALDLFRRNLRQSRGSSWDQNWDQNVLPLFAAQT